MCAGVREDFAHLAAPLLLLRHGGSGAQPCRPCQGRRLAPRCAAVGTKTPARNRTMTTRCNDFSVRFLVFFNFFVLLFQFMPVPGSCRFLPFRVPVSSGSCRFLVFPHEPEFQFICFPVRFTPVPGSQFGSRLFMKINS